MSTASINVLHVSLKRLDQRLAGMVPAVVDTFDGGPNGAHADTVGRPYNRPEPGTSMAWLATTFGLTPLDLDILLIALAPEVDLRYEKLYGYVQEDLTRKRPTVDLVLRLLAVDLPDRLDVLRHFGSGAPLVRHRLMMVGGENTSMLARSLRLDPQVVSLLLEQEGLDPRLVDCCQLVTPKVEAMNVPHHTGQAYLLGTVDKRAYAGAVAYAQDRLLLAADLGRMGAEFERTLRLALREAWFQNAVLLLDHLDALEADQQGTLARVLADDHGTTFVGGTQPWPGHMPTLRLDVPGVERRLAAWQQSAIEHDVQIEDADTLAARYRIMPDQIRRAVEMAVQRAAWQDSEPDFAQAAREQTEVNLAPLARRIEPVYGWDDIVLPPDALAQLQELCQRVIHRERVMADWGFGQKLAAGVTALFAGPSGTGKTMAAEVIANVMGLNLYRIDLSSVVSKYIGETEKNLSRIFDTADNAILFFDEADALFGKRSEVKDAHDRYANIETSHLLQRMETYEGVAILATNFRQNLDEAFTRRLAFSVHFPFPDEKSRRRIWQGIWPDAVPLDTGVDFHYLAGTFKISGGNIKNVALAAAFLAAAENQPVNMDHIAHALRREHQKLGKVMSVEI